MPTKQELEELPLDVLAVWCKRVADKPDHCTETTSAEAEKLRRQWFHLQGTQVPPFAVPIPRWSGRVGAWIT